MPRLTATTGENDGQGHSIMNEARHSEFSPVVLECRNVSKVWTNGSAEVEALNNVSATVSRSQIYAFIGPSGCGKSTLLSLIAGLETPTSGEIVANGELVNSPDPSRCLIYQEPSLFPWLSVLGNVEFPLSLRRVSKEERRTRALALLAQVGLAEFAHAFPHQLSGGMQQRAAVARALIADPELLLMDEPFGSLDEQTRYLMQQFLLEVWEMSKKTIILVTHHIDEAIYLADRIFVMTARPGQLKQLIEVDILRPRDLLSQEVADLRTQLFRLLRDEAKMPAPPAVTRQTGMTT